MFPRFAAVSFLLAGLLALPACLNGGDGETDPTSDPGGLDETWPADLAAVLTQSFPDGTGDLELMPPEQAGPPYSDPVPYPPIDITEIAVGVEGEYLYMRVDFAGTIPTDVVHVAAAGEVEEQWVKNQGMNIALNTDGDIQTGGGGEGVSGIDIFFAVSFDYGLRDQVYANYDFPDGDLHHNQQQVEGELGDGGPGHDFALVRYDVSGLGSFFPGGQTVDVGSWSEAESFNADGSLKYHHFAFDRTIDGEQWSIPAE